MTKKIFSIIIIVYYCIIFYSISPFLLWLSIFSDYLSISLSLLFSLFFFFPFHLVVFGWVESVFKVVFWIGWVSEVGWIGVGFKGGLNRLGFRGVLAGFQFQYWSWIGGWVSELGWIGVVGWIGVGCWIGGGLLNQFQWSELVWISESGGAIEIKLVVAFCLGFSCWVLHFESVWILLLRFELVAGACLNWCGEWWSRGNQIEWLCFAWVSFVAFYVF